MKVCVTIASIIFGTALSASATAVDSCQKKTCLTEKRQPSRDKSCDFSPSTPQEKSPLPPFVHEFETSKGKVVFIAATHGEEPANKATFDLIRQAFANHKFHRVIVESLEYDEGVSPKSYLREIETGHRKLGEPAFLALEANKRGIEFVGGEISDKNLLNYLEENGFTRKDMAGFYILRSWNHDSSSTLKQLINSKRFPEEGQFSSDREFLNWFENIYGKPFPKERDPKLSMPFQGRKDRLQELANQITWSRDRFLAKVIQSSMNRSQSLLVVYGAGHFGPQNCFLQEQ